MAVSVCKARVVLRGAKNEMARCGCVELSRRSDYGRHLVTNSSPVTRGTYRDEGVEIKTEDKIE